MPILGPSYPHRLFRARRAQIPSMPKRQNQSNRPRARRLTLHPMNRSNVTTSHRLNPHHRNPRSHPLHAPTMPLSIQTRGNPHPLLHPQRAPTPHIGRQRMTSFSTGFSTRIGEYKQHHTAQRATFRIATAPARQIGRQTPLQQRKIALPRLKRTMIWIPARL